MNWFKPKPPSADLAVSRAAAVETAGKGLQSGIAAATAVGLTAAVAAGPALPIVAGVGILAAAAVRMYFLNKKLTQLFKRAERLTRRMLSVLKTIQDRNIQDIDTTGVRDAAEQLQITIGELIGPQALKEINDARKESGGLATGQRSSWMGRLKRYGRMLAPASTITRFNEQLLYLVAEFGVLQGEFAIRLDRLPPEQAAAAAAQAETPIDNSSVPAVTNPPPTEIEQPSAVGARRTRRRRRQRKTRRTGDKDLAGKT